MIYLGKTQNWEWGYQMKCTGVFKLMKRTDKVNFLRLTIPVYLFGKTQLYLDTWFFIGYAYCVEGYRPPATIRG